MIDSEKAVDIASLADKPTRFDLWIEKVHKKVYKSSLIDLYLWDYCAVDEWWTFRIVTKKGKLLSDRCARHRCPGWSDSDSDDDNEVERPSTVRLLFVHESRSGKEKSKHVGSLLLVHGEKRATFFEPNGPTDRDHGCYLQLVRKALPEDWALTDSTSDPQRLYPSDIGLCALWNLAFLELHRSGSSGEQIAAFFAALGPDRAKNLIGNLMERVWRKEDKDTYLRLYAKRE